MNKKIYLSPALSVKALELQCLLAGSTPEDVAAKGTNGYDESVIQLSRDENWSIEW